MSTYVVSAHAIDRYRSRVETVDPESAVAAVQRLLADARIRPTPRRWMRKGTVYGSGVRFGYSPRASHIALVLRGQTVVTVLTRPMYRRPPVDRAELRGEASPAKRRSRRRARRHDRDLERRRRPRHSTAPARKRKDSDRARSGDRPVLNRL
jgi:hypothetical protein